MKRANWIPTHFMRYEIGSRWFIEFFPYLRCQCFIQTFSTNLLFNIVSEAEFSQYLTILDLYFFTKSQHENFFLIRCFEHNREKIKDESYDFPFIFEYNTYHLNPLGIIELAENQIERVGVSILARLYSKLRNEIGSITSRWINMPVPPAVIFEWGREVPFLLYNLRKLVSLKFPKGKIWAVC